jgi:hypothetical protein
VNLSVGKERWSGAVESNVSLPIPITADTFAQGLLKQLLGAFPNFRSRNHKMFKKPDPI